MTLCIAAACQYRNKPRIVTCSDWKLTTSYGSAETTDKLRWIKAPNWVALTAGSAPHADALVRAYRESLRDVQITEDNALGLFKKTATKTLIDLKNDYVTKLLGVSYEHLRLKGKKEFPESVLLETYLGVRKIDLGASLIIAGFVPLRSSKKPLICRIDGDSDVSISDHFECIGSGGFVARPNLLRRSYSSDVSLMDAMYRLYEAKKLAEIVPSVGEDTSIDILYPDGELEQLSLTDGHDRMDSMCRRFGPKPNIVKPRLERKYFESLDFLRLH